MLKILPSNALLLGNTRLFDSIILPILLNNIVLLILLNNTIMAKKQFTNSFQDLFTPTTNEPIKGEIVKSYEEIDDEILRTTLLLSRKTYDTIKVIAFWERKQIKDVLQDALRTYIESKDKTDLEKACSEYKRNHL